ncbi:type 1 glutamine amidotransferase domain-containing protein [Roseomonas sp. KE2513]|uniref:type 1 glutamine amidotransferase domain-containing protein n=1 Tax=Roseomonas sp. KE2513 TaxID=2479202 RepID=UPI0018DF6FE6|nr:type 1 glutamine amidotransferase domain-containing protein [Roseomonas sp. KE2513]MBI0539238.1 type 1 glutamine amidotransferase domain-containing protein [Roseomonas sp. KE2513]
MTKGTVLVAGSNATRIELRGGGLAAIGQYLNETVVPAMALIEAGYDVVLATPDRTRPHIDEASDSAQHFGGDETAYARARRFYADDPSMNEVRTLRSVVEDGLDRFAGLFVPGGHAPVVDLMQDADLGTILRHFHEAGKPTALLCHGPVALAAAIPRAREFRAALIAGDKAKAAGCAQGWAYAGYRMTVFSASEERIAEDALLHGKLYFDMPEALQAAGGKVSVNPVDFAPNVVVDRELITGQNPSSDHQLAARLIEALDRVLAAA